MTPAPQAARPDSARDIVVRPTWFAHTVRFTVAPLILLSSGFVTTDFLLSGSYTWPRTSRIIFLTLTILVLAHEFVYKEQLAQPPRPSHARAVKALLYSCVIPYAIGACALLALARLAR